MKNSMLLIFLAVGGVIAYLFLSKRQQPVQAGTNTILGSTGSASAPMPVQSKAAKERTDNTAAYVQAGASLLSSLINKSGTGAAVKYEGDLPFLPGNWLSRKPTSPDLSTTPGINKSVVYAGSGGPQASSGQYAVEAGPIYSNPSQYGEPIGPIYSDTSIDPGGEVSAPAQASDSSPYTDYFGN